MTARKRTPEPTAPRKGARRMSQIPKAVLAALERGEEETANLVEWLAVDTAKLLRNVLLEVDGRMPVRKIIGEDYESLGVMKKLERVGRGLYQYSGNSFARKEIYRKFGEHHSDIVRYWAVYMDFADRSLTVEDRLSRARRFATDPHFGVREVAWIAVRPFIADKLDKGITLLMGWTADEDPNIRRFASEITRPRGVWCCHIKELKENPEKGFPLIEPLRSDPSRYVGNSVGNWLNDAGKSAPGKVLKLCNRWRRESPTPETAYIIKRALRNL